MNKKYAIIVAGGIGARMGSPMPKQFIRVKDKPVLYYTIRSFLDAYPETEIILVAPSDYLDLAKVFLQEHFPGVAIQLVTGGDTRFQSVRNGLAQVTKESIVFVHDGVRCLLTPALIQRCYEAASMTGTAIPAIVARDSIRLLKENGTESFDRNNVMMIQTPQTFRSDIILPAFQTEYREEFTDEATVVEAAGVKISVVEGEENNIKITRPVDLVIAEKILVEREAARS